MSKVELPNHMIFTFHHMGYLKYHSEHNYTYNIDPSCHPVIHPQPLTFPYFIMSARQMITKFDLLNLQILACFVIKFLKKLK